MWGHHLPNGHSQLISARYRSPVLTIKSSNQWCWYSECPETLYRECPQAIGMCPIGQMPIVSEEQKDSSNPLIPGPSLPFIVVVYSETKTQSLNFSKLLRGKIWDPGPVHIRIYNIDKIPKRFLGVRDKVKSSWKSGPINFHKRYHISPLWVVVVVSCSVSHYLPLQDSCTSTRWPGMIIIYDSFNRSSS